LVHYLGVAWSLGFMPGTLGLDYPELIRSATVAIVIGQVVVVAVVVVSLWRRPTAWRAWVLFAVTLLVILVVTGEERAGNFGPNLGLNYHDLSYTPVLTMLTLGLAFLPLRPEIAPSGTPVTALVERADRPAPGLRRVTAVVTAGLVGGVLVASGLSTHKIAEASASWSAAAYLTRFAQSQAQVEAADPQAFLYNYETTLVAKGLFPYDLYSYTIARVDPGLALDRSQGHGYLVSPDGAVVPAVLSSDAGLLTTNRALVVGGTLVDTLGAVCDFTTAPGELVIPLARSVPARYAFLRFSYAVNQPTAVGLQTGEAATYRPALWTGARSVDLPAGRGSRLEALRVRPMDDVAFTLPAGRTFCVSSLDVGDPRAEG
jgi:hypothetical protein